MTEPFLDAADPHLLPLSHDQIRTGLARLNRGVTRPNPAIGEDTHASAFGLPQDCAARLVPHASPGAPEGIARLRALPCRDRRLGAIARATPALVASDIDAPGRPAPPCN